MGFTSALGRAPSATSTARLLFLPLENFWAIRMGRTPNPRREPNDLGNKKQRLRDGQGARGAHGQSRAAIGYHAPGASLAAAYHGREGSRARLGTLGTEDVQATYPSFWGFFFFFSSPNPLYRSVGRRGNPCRHQTVVRGSTSLRSPKVPQELASPTPHGVLSSSSFSFSPCSFFLQKLTSCLI